MVHNKLIHLNYIFIYWWYINVNHQFHSRNNVIHIHLLLLSNVTAFLLLHDIIFLTSLMFHNLKIVKIFWYRLLLNIGFLYLKSINIYISLIINKVKSYNNTLQECCLSIWNINYAMLVWINIQINLMIKLQSQKMYAIHILII